MTLTPGVPRAKLFVAEHGRAIAAVLAVVGVLALAGAGWVYANPPTTTVTDTTDEQRFESAVDTSAVVTGDSAMFQSGQRVENQPVYFTEAMPNLTIDLETAVPADQSVRVDHRLVVVMQATSDGETFWEHTRVLVDEETNTTDGTVNTSTTLDVPALADRLAPISEEVGSAGSLSVAVELTTVYESERYSGTLTEQQPLSLSDRTYALDSFSAENRERTTETRTTTLPTRNRFAYGIPAAVGVVALLSSVAVFVLSRRKEEWRTLDDEIHRARYAEWISEGSLRGEIAERSIAVASVEDLVDVAIDQEKRVIYDPDLNTHAVIDGPVVYYHGPIDPRTTPEDD